MDQQERPSPEFRAGDRVRRRSGPRDLTGMIVAFAVRDEVPCAIVRWSDERLVPNPTFEPIADLEMVN